MYLQFKIPSFFCFLALPFITIPTIMAQPTITSLTIYNGSTGAAVGLRGANFNTVAANNIVYFGATKAIVSSSTTTAINVVVPSGATFQPVSVLNTGTGLLCNSQRAFMPSFNSTGYVQGALHFDPKTDFSTTGSNAYGIIIADLDGDGKPDVMVTNNESNTISIYKNTASAGIIASSSFASPVLLATGTNPGYLKAADVDGDGKLDIIVANSGSGTVSVFRNTSVIGTINSGSFATKVNFAAGSNPFDIAIADFDGDGKMDIAVSNSIGTANSITILRNTGTTGVINTASFALPVAFGVGSIPVKLVAADFDGDGKPDIAVTNNSSNTVSVLRNTCVAGSITIASFANKVDFTTGANPRGIFAADMDNDGKFDIVVTNRTANTISVFRNTTTSGTINTASFAAQETFTSGSIPYDVAMGDIDGNGKPDIVITNYGASTVSIMRNIGSTGVINTTTFVSKVDFSTGGTGGPFGLAIGDLDGDGKPDIAVANSNSSGSFSVLRNNMLMHIANSGTVCVGATRQLSDSTPGGTWSSNAAGTATVSATGVVTGITPGSTIITYTVTGIWDTAQITVLVRPTDASITASPTSVCIGLPFTLTAGAATGSVTLTSYNWSGPNTYNTTSTSPTATLTPTTTATSGSYTLTVTYSNGCTSLPVVTTPSVTATYAHFAGAIVGNNSICLGQPTSFTDTASGGTWSSSNPAIATINSSGIANGAALGICTISYSIANSCGASVVSKSITVNAVPSITGTTPGNRCNVGTVSLSAVTSNGTIDWFTALAGGASIFTGPTYATPVLSTTTTYYTNTTSLAGCTSPNRVAVTANINPLPTLTATSNSSPVCTGGSVTLSATGPSNIATYSWSGPDAITNPGSATATIQIATTNGVDIYSVTVGNGTGIACMATYTTSVTVNARQAWLTTATTTNWNTAANWACGWVPVATDSVLLPAGATNAPEILPSASAIALHLNTEAGAVLKIDSGAVLNLKGNLANSGIISGMGYIVLNGTAAQLIKGMGTVSNIQVSNNSGVSINTTADTLTLTGNLKLTFGNFNTNGRLVLSMSDNQSVDHQNGRIGQITGGSITGQVIISQFINGGRRAYRFWGTPFTGPTSLSQLEQSIDITGPGGATHGFTTSPSNNPSAYWYHTLVANSKSGLSTGDYGWIPFTWAIPTPGLLPANDTNLINKYEGMRLFVRGKKGEGLDGSAYTPSPVTVRQYGNINTGSFNMPLQKGTQKVNGFWSQDYNQKSNPYPSPVDIGAVVFNAWADSLLADSKLYVWDPFGGVNGIFVTINENMYTPYILPANASFQVRARYGHDSSYLHFTESNKNANLPASLLLRLVDQEITLGIYDTTYQLWDALYLKFNDAATDNLDNAYDGGKPLNPGLNFYSRSADGAQLSWDERPFKPGKIIPLGIATTQLKDFIIHVDQFTLLTGGTIYLHDKFMQQYVLLAANTGYHFSITSDTASQGEGRFAIEEASINVDVSGNNILQATLFPNPAKNSISVNYFSPYPGSTNIKILSINGRLVFDKYLGVQQSGSINIALLDFEPGMYTIEIISGQERAIQKFLKE